MCFEELMVSWEEATWTLIRILRKRPCFLPLLPLYTQPSCHGGSWHTPSDWAQTVLSAEEFLAWWRFKGHIINALLKQISHGPTAL